MAAVLGRGRQPVVAARLGPGRPPASSRRPARRWPRRSAPGRARCVFTGGGTEADNLAVKGLYWARRSRGPAPAPHPGQRRRAPRGLDAVAVARRARGRRGRVAAGRRRRPGAPGDAARPRSRATPASVALVTVMWANNEVGTVQPIAELADGRPRVRRPDPLRRRAGGRPAAGRLRRERPGRDDGHRPQDRRPARRRRARARPRRRPASRCCTAAARSATSAPARWTPRPSPGSRRPPRLAVKRQPERGRAAGRAARRPGPPGARRRARRRPQRRPRPVGRHRLPGNAHFSFPGCEGDALLLLLDARGIECSTGSACSAGVPQPSHVLLAMGVPEDAGPRLAAVLARPHLDRRPTSTRSSRRSARSSSGPAAPARTAVTGREALTDEGARRDVRRRRLGGRGRPRRRRRPRRHRRAPRAVQQPAVVPHRRARLLHPRGRPRRPPGGRRASASRSTSGTSPSGSAQDVVDDFVAEYAAGRTPNPCLRCNEKIKFAAVLDRALALGFDAVVHRPLRPASTDGRLHRAVDAGQGPVLRARRAHRRAARARDVPARRHPPRPRCAREAERRGLAVADKPDSHDICFIADGDTAGFLRGAARRRSRARSSTPTAAVVGEHDGAYALHRRPAARAARSAGRRRTAGRATCSTSRR